MPVYNTKAELLTHSITSVLEQRFKDFELIVVNDGSTLKTTIEVLNTFKAQNLNELVIINTQNGGVSSARNTGIKNAKYNYIAFIDSDDYVSKEFYETLVNTQLKHKTTTICAGRTNVYSNKNVTIKPKHDGKITISEMLNRLSHINEDYLINNIYNKIYKKDSIVLFDTTLSMGEDLVFNLQYFESENHILFINETGYFYVIYDDNTTRHSLFNYSKNYELSHYISYRTQLESAFKNLKAQAKTVDAFFAEKAFFNLSVMLKNIFYKNSPYTSFKAQLLQLKAICNYKPVRESILNAPANNGFKKMIKLLLTYKQYTILYVITRIKLSIS